jgi:hypothetical protein
MSDKPKEYVPVSVTATWDGSGQLHILFEGPFTEDHLMKVAFMCNRVAGQIIDGKLRAAQDAMATPAGASEPGVQPSPIVPIRGRLQDEGRMT